MFHTPPVTRKAKMLQAKSELHKQKKTVSNAYLHEAATSGNENATRQTEKTIPQKLFFDPTGSSIKSEPLPHMAKSKPAKSITSCRCSQKSSHSKEARKKQLMLEAAQQKAKIQIELINASLEAQLAALSDEEEPKGYSSHTDELPRSEIEDWVDHQSNHKEMTTEQQAPEYGTQTGELYQAEPDRRSPLISVPEQRAAIPEPGLMSSAAPPPHDGTVTALNNAVNVLAGALKDISSMNGNNPPHASLLSRMSTSKDLPEFSGDLLDWLQFKQAYDESTLLCKFTPKENLWRLRKCLRGAAKDAVAALFISATSPDKVLSTLELRFGNPDCIISKILQDIKKLQPLSQEYHKDIVAFSVKVQNIVEAVRAVGREEYLQGVNIVSIILSKLPTILISKWSDYSFKLITEAHKPRLVILSDFLSEEAVKISTTASTITGRNEYLKNRPNIIPTRTQTVLIQAEERNNNCLFCRKAVHNLTNCKQFKKALRKVRWQFVKKHSLCYKCLIAKHDRNACTAPVCDKEGCNLEHHRLLHYTPGGQRECISDDRKTAPTTTTDVQRQRSVSTSETITHINASASERKVLLKVLPIRVYGPNGIVNATALLDDGSSVSLISAGLAERIGLRGRSETLSVRGAWNDNALVCESMVMNVDISAKHSSKIYNIRIRCVKELNLPTQNLSFVNYNSYSHLMDIKDKLCTSDLKPELLIGQDNFELLLPLKIKLGKVNEPSATLTPLGWCVHGKVRVPRAAVRAAAAASTLVAGAGASDLPATGGESTLTILETEEVSATSQDDSLLQEIYEEVRRSFALDALGVSGQPRQNADDVRAVAQLEQSAALVDGRWYISLPWKSSGHQMPDSYSNALKRLKGIEKKMQKDLGFATRYQERVNHLLDNDYARELVDATISPKTWYLPHFGVDNPNKRKLRLVFDAAGKVNGYCLNDYLLTGPDLLSSLLGIMLRFRENKVAVTGDIKDMFLRVKVHAEDQHALRFLWRRSPTENIKTYVMTSLIFGANCSPFVAQFIKNKNAERYESSLPAAVNAIRNSHYMDDYIDSLPDEASAIEMVKNITNIHRAGGFEIRNWTSNSVAVLDSIPKETLGTAAVRFKLGQQYEGERTLGLIWFPADDTLGFDVSLKRIPQDIIQGIERPTKRLMLRVIMSIFDVIGFLAPFTIQGKIMLQDTWRLNISWDDYIPEDIYARWVKWIDLFYVINNIRIPRYHAMTACAGETTCASKTEDKPVKNVVAPPSSPSRGPPPLTSAITDYETVAVTSSATKIDNNSPSLVLSGSATCSYESVSATSSATNTITSDFVYNNLQLHIFSDASTKALCSVAYWRWEANDKVYVSFIASKSRVVPIKPITVPRLELQAALLSARLANTICKEHKLTPMRRYIWCDSTTVLHWIRNNTRSYKAYEANRLGEIDELTLISEWKYVPTKLNIADLATREAFDPSMYAEWLSGPRFLYFDSESWPKDVIQPDTEEAEIVAVVQDLSSNLPVPDPLRFSSWLRILRTTATVLKFINRLKGHPDREVSVQTMKRAELLLLRYAQWESFADDIAAIKKVKTLAKNSRLLTLSPILDEDGLLRVGGRIDAAVGVTVDVKRPVILDGRHPIARLIVRHYHIKAAHGNQETVVNQLREKYWILRLRPTVKTVTSQCMMCRIKKSKPQVPRMGDLPQARLAHHQRPFSYCGLDLFGPMEVTVGRRREKRYGVLFTCLTVRAIHIETVHSLTSDSLIMALRRMAARRGWPRHLYSDNGTNLRGAERELQQSMRDLDIDALKDVGVNNGMDWTFIPPASPHWGGAWERLIRSVKTSLRVVLTERAPRDEVLNTLLAEVENLVNSRPLMHVSVEPDGVESLTPNHFLIGTTSNLPVIGAFDSSDMYLRRHWRTSQHLADMFWHRWVKEILPDLLPRRRWQEEHKPLQVGDLVLVVDPNSPRNSWPKGLITGVFPGKDGRVRLVEVKVGSRTWRRSVARVAPIFLSDECCNSTRVGKC